MRKYLQAYQDVFNSGVVLDDVVKRHINTQILIDRYLPDSAAFFYVVKLSEGKYNFIGKQQEHVSSYPSVIPHAIPLSSSLILQEEHQKSGYCNQTCRQYPNTLLLHTNHSNHF